MLIYGVSGIFAPKKTIKQFLQPMIEQVLRGGGWMCRENVWISFSELLYFCVGFFQFTNAFFGSILYQYLHIFFMYIICISSKSQTVFWAQNFRDVQLISNFFKISSLALILQFLEVIVVNKLPNELILIQQ